MSLKYLYTGQCIRGTETIKLKRSNGLVKDQMRNIFCTPSKEYMVIATEKKSQNDKAALR